MAFNLKGQHDSGFSMVELMIVVAIIGVLAAIAAPKMQVFMAKAIQAEGKTIVANIYTLEQVYWNENSGYAALDTVGYKHSTNSKWNSPTFTATTTGYTVETTNNKSLCAGVAAGSNKISGTEDGSITAQALTCN